jgi:putative oxidoreductase
MADLLAHQTAHHPPYARWAHIVLRVVTGLLFMQHGAQKLLGLFGGFMGTAGATAPVGSMMWVAGVIELVGGLLIAIGLFTRIAAFVMAGEMAYAYFTVHLPKSVWPIQNGGEAAVLFCFLFLYFLATGAGAGSLDYVRTRNRPRPVMTAA